MLVFYIPVFKNHFVTKISFTHLQIISKNEDSPDNNKNLKYKFVWFPIQKYRAIQIFERDMFICIIHRMNFYALIHYNKKGQNLTI